MFAKLVKGASNVQFFPGKHTNLDDKYLIRHISQKSIWRLNTCTRGFCSEQATHYLVRRPSLPSDKAESRQRRCEPCARMDARALRIEFPESQHKGAN